MPIRQSGPLHADRAGGPGPDFRGNPTVCESAALLHQLESLTDSLAIVIERSHRLRPAGAVSARAAPLDLARPRGEAGPRPGDASGRIGSEIRTGSGPGPFG